MSAADTSTQGARLPFAKCYAGALLLSVLNMSRLKLPWISLRKMDSILGESSLELVCRYYYFYFITESIKNLLQIRFSTLNAVILYLFSLAEDTALCFRKMRRRECGSFFGLSCKLFLIMVMKRTL